MHICIIGGAAGAFSKITGTLGKGLATLSMDKDYQNAKKKMDAKPTIWQNLGQNVVMVNLNFYTLVLFNCNITKV
jgi:hypothetical protein